MARRISRSFLESASRKQLSAYLEGLGHETYKDESVKEMRETALELFEQGQPDEAPTMFAYGEAS